MTQQNEAEASLSYILRDTISGDWMTRERAKEIAGILIHIGYRLVRPDDLKVLTDDGSSFKSKIREAAYQLGKQAQLAADKKALGFGEAERPEAE